MHILEEWRIRDVEQKADRAVSQLYKFDSIYNDVASLERQIGALGACIDGLRATVEACLSRIEKLEQKEIEG